ncbi:MAG TPA: hypothetical protein VK208_06915 [Pyrinomonadaceae bacterium]|jgi:hypothetical protein|nr:hypothetical protein [Pyrinomonadaceae bacterium]
MFATVMLAQVDTTFNKPSYFIPVFVGLFVLGAVASLVASVLGFARARAFGPSARWFSFAAVCLLLFHIQILAFGFGAISNDTGLAFSILTFFNLFIILGAVCAIIGFIKMTSPR